MITNNEPIFDFEYDKVEGRDYDKLEQMFIDHYFFHEIGVETVDRFKHHLKVKWRELIVNNNKKWKVNQIEIDPLSTHDQRSIYNDTPSSQLGDDDYASAITDMKGRSGVTEIELLEVYNTNLRDLDLEFINSFSDLFMGVF